MPTVRLENWSVIHKYELNSYYPPEANPCCLRGTVYGHHRLEDGKSIVTSRIVGGKGRTIRTASGTEYELGEVDPDYLEFVRSIGLSLDPLSPIKFAQK